MYLAEFTYPGTSELVSDLLIEAPEAVARDFALQHASIWGLDLFSLARATQEQVQFHQSMQDFATLTVIST